MAEDTTGWSEKGNKSKSGADGASGSTPSRPSKRDTSSKKAKGESNVVRVPSEDAGARKVAKAAATAGQRDVSFASRLGFPALVALICLLGIGAVVYARSTREALAKPVQNLDHWHSVYGVYNCNLEGENKYLPSFQSSLDDAGIHSHGDGVLHIHPFFELSSGDNAQFRHFFDEMDVQISTEEIVVSNIFDTPVQLAAGNECADGSGAAEIKILEWDFDFEALVPIDSNRPDPTIYEQDLGLVKFKNDRQVFIIAYMGENTDISQMPLPPQERFDAMNGSSAAIDFQPSVLNPVDTGVDIDSVEVEVGGTDDNDVQVEIDTDSDE